MNDTEIVIEIKNLWDAIDNINRKLSEIDQQNKEEVEEAIAELADIVVNG